MKKAKVKYRESFEHLEYVIKNTTPYQRFKCLEQMWDFWYEVRKNLKLLEVSPQR